MSRNHLERLRELIGRWEQVTLQVERGYDFSFDDYLNDMDLRRIIDERVREYVNDGPSDMADSLGAAIDALDARFRAATFETPRNIWGDAAEQEEGWTGAREWYYYRLPNARGEWLTL